MIKIFIILQILLYITSSWAGPLASDPCSGTTCGKGAECRYRSALVVCVCPDSSEGDPFVECVAPSSTTENYNHPPTEVTTESQDFQSSNFNLSPSTITTLGETSSSKYFDPKAQDDPLPSYFPSAPPTLSHYAHTPPFSQNSEVGHTNEEKYRPFSEPLAPPPQRPQHSFHGTINHDLSPSQVKGQVGSPATENSGSPSPQHGGAVGFQVADNQMSRFPAEHRDITIHRPGHQQHQFTNPFNQNNGNIQNRISAPNQFSNSHHPPHGQTPFNLNQDSAQAQHRPDMVKDPLGIYMDCLTVNNRIVCADAPGSTRHDLHPPIQQQGNQGFEHRLIAIGNENPNTFQHLPPPRLDGFLNSKLKPSGGHLRPAGPPGGQGAQWSNGHHQGHPQGTINLFPSASSSAEGQHEGQTKVKLQPPPPSYPETKPYTPQVGSDDAKLCERMCGEGAICQLFHGRPICGCPEGHTGDPSKKCYPEMNTKFDPNTCQRHTDCGSTMICLNNQCTDPCLIKNNFDTSNISSFHESLDAVSNKNEKNMCGANAKCSVIEHIPLCSCEQNHFGNPYVGCVP